MGNGLHGLLQRLRPASLTEGIEDLANQSSALFFDSLSQIENPRQLLRSVFDDAKCLFLSGQAALFGSGFTLENFIHYYPWLPNRLNSAYTAALSYTQKAMSSLSDSYKNLHDSVTKNLEELRIYIKGRPGIQHLTRNGYEVRQNIIYQGEDLVGYYQPDRFNPSFAIVNDEHWRTACSLEQLGYPVARRMNNQKP